MKERDNKRQIIFRFVKYKKPNGTSGGSIGRSTLTLVEKTEDGVCWFNDSKLWEKLKDWNLNRKGVKFGKATKTITVNVLVTEP